MLMKMSQHPVMFLKFSYGIYSSKSTFFLNICDIIADNIFLRHDDQKATKSWNKMNCYMSVGAGETM